MARLGIVTVLLALALTACSGSADEPSVSSSTAASSPDSTAEVREAVQAYSDAYLTGDGEAAYAMLSAHCQDVIGKDQMIQLVDAASSEYGTALPIKSFDAEVSEELARVTYTYSVAAINQTAQPWVREADTWRYDDC